MRGILATGTLVLVILGIGNHLWWLAAVALLYLYATHGRGSPGTTPPAASGALPDSYRAYRERRDRQARWERRYRRERPFEARRQQREKAG
ncbi:MULTISPECIES: hypothetical protein [Streptomyces]|uniref:Integral membrane protein n=2 Tax=Streptomyces TaxID=1883 RepID=A0ABS9JCH1_9ACTN|nr:MULTISPECIES: hypothetical protein [Streptomyces]CUW28017.1 hypothetical protein TUE45_02747 [Streptomyces reticuli]AKN68912.1 hypothetical protein QR97_02975 [Streptomyces sp. PBH53]MCG0063255.1 hypothetical protein [Streptomyces tricolor]OYP17995.1 hypothetical protein CFC35_28775 [Streptomyces sp. FBKL.4005]BCM66432.1 hypothetical protein EASAB2608_01766 [Streptomyces sp. EAS-AB2608]